MPRLRTLLLPAVLFISGCQAGSDANRAVGTLEWERIEVAAQVAEPVQSWAVKEGDTVSAGQLLLQLDSERLQARAAAADAALAQARAQLDEVERGTRPERIAQAQAVLRGSEATLLHQQTELHRLNKLLQKKLIAPEQVDAARNALAMAAANRDSAQAQRDELVHGATDEQRQQTRAAVNAAQANASAAATDLAEAQITAPVAGRVDELPFKVGERPPLGGVVAVILAGEHPYARVYVPMAIRARVRPGSTATLHIESLDKTYTGTLRKIAAEPAFTPFFALTEHDRGRLSYVAEIDVDQGGAELPSGVPVDARFDLDAAE